jgi:tetratricopeptide (TPR) repeat protein
LYKFQEKKSNRIGIRSTKKKKKMSKESETIFGGAMELPSWLGWDKWYVVAGAAVAGVGALTLVGFVHSKIYGDDGASKSKRGGGGAGPAGMFGGPSGGGSLPPGFMEAMVAASGGGAAGAGAGGAKSSSSSSKSANSQHAQLQQLRERQLQAAAAARSSRGGAGAGGGTEDDRRLATLIQQARGKAQLGDFDSAAPLYVEALDLLRRMVASAPQRRQLLTVPLRELGEVYVRLGQYGDAEPLFAEALDIQECFLESAGHGADPSQLRNVLQLQDDVIMLQEMQGKWAAADAQLVAMKERMHAMLQPHEFGSLAPVLKRQVPVALNLGDLERAEELARELAGLPLHESATNRELVLGQNKLPLGQVLLRARRTDDARQHFQQVLEEHALPTSSTSKELVELVLRKTIVRYYIRESMSDEAIEQLRVLAKKYVAKLDGGRPTVEIDRQIRALVYESINDLTSMLHNVGADEEARQHYATFKSRKCAVLSHSHLMQTSSAKVVFDITKRPLEALFVLNLALVLDTTNSQRPFIPAGAFLDIEYEVLIRDDEVIEVVEEANEEDEEANEVEGEGEEAKEVEENDEENDDEEETETKTDDIAVPASSSPEHEEAEKEEKEKEKEKEEEGEENDAAAAAASSTSAQAEGEKEKEEADDTYVVDPKYMRHMELPVTEADVANQKMTIEFPRELGSRNHIYEILITVYKDSTKEKRIGYHHQLVNCSVDTSTMDPSTMIQALHQRRLIYAPQPAPTRR